MLKEKEKGVEKMTERFMVDDAGTLIDMQTRDTYHNHSLANFGMTVYISSPD